MRTKFLKLFLLGFSSLVLLIGVVNHYYPIVPRLVFSSSRIVGKSIQATVKLNGVNQKKIKVFQVDTYWDGELANYYVIFNPYLNDSRLRFLGVFPNQHFVGLPSSTNKENYDIVFGLLFQGEVGSKFTPIQDDMKGLSFDPKLIVSDKHFSFQFPITINSITEKYSIDVKMK